MLMKKTLAGNIYNLWQKVVGILRREFNLELYIVRPKKTQLTRNIPLGEGEGEEAATFGSRRSS